MTLRSVALVLVVAMTWGCASETSAPDDGTPAAEDDGVANVSADGQAETVTPSAESLERSIAHARAPRPDCDAVHPPKTPEGPVPDPWHGSAAPDPARDPK